MKVLVTGGAGFIGSEVVRQLLAGGHDVRVLHLPRENLRNLDGLDVERIPGDITDADVMRRTVSGCQQVFHLAAIYALWLPRPALMREVNVGGTRTVLDACLRADVERVVYTSSIANFGGQGLDRDATERSEYSLGKTGDLYAQSKHESHLVALEFVRLGLRLAIVAPCGPIGPGDVGPTPTGRLLIAAANLPLLAVNHSCHNLIDVRDVARGHVLAAEHGRVGESYLLGHENWWLQDVVREVYRHVGRRRPVVQVPDLLATLGGHLFLARARLVGKPPLLTPAAARIARLGLRADCRKARDELGLECRPVSTSIADALHWFAQAGYVSNQQVRRKLLESR